ncbi:MAG: type VI secretion system ATPase TssH, partial [Verrucomicrobiaceae bacterium]
LGEIVKIQLQRVISRLGKQNLHLDLTDEALQLIADQGYDPAYGARPLKRAIQRQLLDPLSLQLLDGKFHEGDTIRVAVEDGGIVFGKAA